MRETTAADGRTDGESTHSKADTGTAARVTLTIFITLHHR